MDWASAKAFWPLAEHSKFISLPPHDWHVQDLGTGEVLVLLHGTGGATQSFRHLAPALAKHYRIVMPDYPGQGFTKTTSRRRMGLDPLTEDIAELLAHLEVRPAAFVCHSAGAAIGLNLLQHYPGCPLVGLNPALGHFEGAAGWLFPVLAKLLALNPFVPAIFAGLSKTPGRVEGLIGSTGSPLDPAGTQLYRALLSDREHVDGTLAMMSQWSIDGLLARLGDIREPVLFLTGSRDGAVPPKTAMTAAQGMPDARVIEVPGPGHLIHETDPEVVEREILRFLSEVRSDQPSSA